MEERHLNNRGASFSELFLKSIRSTGFWSVIAGSVGLFAVIAGGITFFLIEEINDFAISVVIIGIILALVAVILSPRAVAMYMAGRQGRYGSNVAIMAVAFLLIIVLANFLLYRNGARFDITATRVFTLAPQTEQILDNLTVDIRANAFFAPNDPTANLQRQRAEDLLNEFQRQTNRFSYRFIDPDFNRGLALQYAVEQHPVIVFEDMSTGKQQAINILTEQNFVTGILISTGVEQKKVYFLTGHKERSITRDPVTGEIDSEGLDSALTGMQRDNYAVRPLNLKQRGSVPEDAAVLLIAGPKSDLEKGEKEALSDYIKSGGRILALFDPDIPEMESEGEDEKSNKENKVSGIPPTFADLVSQWGIRLGTGRVADAVSNVSGEMLTPMMQRANSQYFSNAEIQITDRLDVTFFPEATSVETVVPLEDMPPTIRFVPLAFTTPASWLETDLEIVSLNPGVERLGPFAVAVALEASGTVNEQERHNLAKFVIFSDSDFAKNRWFASTQNSDFFLNSVNWLAEDHDLISIRPTIYPTRTLVVNSRERDFIKWSSWLFPPAIMLILGFVVWWRRR